MATLGEHHRRRILITFQHMDELLSQSLHVIARAQTDLQPRHVQDISASKLLRIEKHFQLIREQMNKFLERYQIALPEPSTPSSWILKTNLTSLDMALEDLHPHKLKGYGEMDSTVARELTQTLQEIRKQVSQLHKTLE
ncbi:MAG TPA: hypothetical protein VMG30_16850 [Acidobacteriota bacterium]|nr:hypothetical protein [Acidobacteriota bacterium]